MQSKETLTLNEAAQFFSVSVATIRNWIKTDYLISQGKGLVSKKSALAFQQKILGREKLNQRANKQKKDSHDHQKLTAFLLKQLSSKKMDADTAGEIYEKSLSNAYRNREGVYYTPSSLLPELFKQIKPTEKSTFCDPCCGSGNFIIQALEQGFLLENIYAFDIDPVAIAITQARIEKRFGIRSNHIKCTDFLMWSIQNSQLFDYIYTNQTWGKKLSKKEKQNWAQQLNISNEFAHDTCSLFFQCCLKKLTTKGYLGLLLPDSVFNIASFETMRKEILRYEILRLADFGKIFKGLQTNAVWVEISRSTHINEKIPCFFQGKEIIRHKSSFQHNPKFIFNLNCSSSEAEVIEHIFSIPHKTLENYASWGLGIVTGNNEKWLEKVAEKNSIPVLKGSDIKGTHKISQPSCFISHDLSKYQQVAPIELYQSPEKLIYKFISSNLCFYLDRKQNFMLNSANMVIVHESFPIDMQILGDLFNSDFMNWVFRKIFATHKVLRKDLETLPIHTQFLQNDYFDEANYIQSLNLEKLNNGTFRIKK